MLVPIVASQFVEGWNWSGSDYVFAAIMILLVASLFELGNSFSQNTLYRTGFGLALLSGFLIFWGNLAVGFIGSEDNPANLMYLGVLAIAFLGATMSGFKPQGMARTMFVTAAAMAIVPVIALMMNSTFAEIPEAAGTPYIFALNTVFVVLFIGAGLLFRQAHEPSTN
jgi:hypothetical protein